jgi:hypothetical protein
VIAPEADLTYPEERKDYGGKVVFESCGTADQELIIRAVTLHPQLSLRVDALETAIGEHIDCAFLKESGPISCSIEDKMDCPELELCQALLRPGGA